MDSGESNRRWVVYMIQAQSGKLYTGITNDLERRLQEHQTKERGARFFYFSGAEKIVYSEPHPDRSSASKREWAIKKMNRKEKEELIAMQQQPHGTGPQAIILLPEEDDALLQACRVDTYRSSGPGGQHVNVTNSAVRLTHLATGLVVASQKERSHTMNLQDCLKKLRAAVEKLNYRKPKRVATRKSRSVKIEESHHKAKDSEKKRMRNQIRYIDE